MPKFEDHCLHGTESYVGSLTDEDEAVYDVYVYESDIYGPPGEPHVCLRYGDEGADYLSPGPLSDVKRLGLKSRLYFMAYEMVMGAG